MRKCKVIEMKSKKFINNLITYAIVILAFIYCKAAISNSVPGISISRSLKGQLIPICVYIVLAVSLNLTVGISGELSLGHAGFMCIGAFTGTVVSAWLLGAFQLENTIVRLIISMILGGAVAGVFGFLIGIPVLRLRGDYLAIVTLAFGEIIRNLFNCIYVNIDGGVLQFAFNSSAGLTGKEILAGPKGSSASVIATLDIGFALVIFTLFVVLNLINSRTGRAIMATRDNRIAAESVGINVTRYKMIAFVVSAVLAGMAGALYGLNYSKIPPTKFKFDTSILILVFVVLGGIGSIRGSIIAATLLTILPEVLRKFSDYRMLVYAIVLIVVMLATNNPKIKSWIASLTGKLKSLIQSKKHIVQTSAEGDDQE